MRKLSDLSLTAAQKNALVELRQRLTVELGVERMILYGSAARGEADEESDLDLLVLTREPFTRAFRHKITDTIFEVNLRYGTNFSSLVVHRNNWETGALSVLPIRDEILRDGITV